MHTMSAINFVCYRRQEVKSSENEPKAATIDALKDTPAISEHHKNYIEYLLANSRKKSFKKNYKRNKSKK